MPDIHRKWGHRWLTPKARVKNSSIQGIGTFAKKKINKNEVVVVLGGIIVPTSERQEYISLVGPFGHQISKDFFICPSSRKELKRIGTFNHSCNPNMGYQDLLTGVAIKNINQGEEIVLDYSFYETSLKSFECNCSSINCRRIIKPTDWKNKKLQKKYGKYFSPYLREKF